LRQRLTKTGCWLGVRQWRVIIQQRSSLTSENLTGESDRML
jgi:hypothetical protein